MFDLTARSNGEDLPRNTRRSCRETLGQLVGSRLNRDLPGAWAHSVVRVREPTRLNGLGLRVIRTLPGKGAGHARLVEDLDNEVDLRDRTLHTAGHEQSGQDEATGSSRQRRFARRAQCTYRSPDHLREASRASGSRLLVRTSPGAHGDGSLLRIRDQLVANKVAAPAQESPGPELARIASAIAASTAFSSSLGLNWTNSVPAIAAGT